jgi:hypothetical protein
MESKMKHIGPGQLRARERLAREVEMTNFRLASVLVAVPTRQVKRANARRDLKLRLANVKAQVMKDKRPGGSAAITLSMLGAGQ